ncbi:MAG: alpha-2-macroglobulin family protein, partial [bacterium]
MRCIRTSRSIFHAPITVYVIAASFLMVCLCAGINGNAQVKYPPYLNQFSGLAYSLNASPYAWQNNTFNRASQFSSLFNTYQFNQPFQNQYTFSYPMTYSFGYNAGLQGYAGPYAGNRQYASLSPSLMYAYGYAPSLPILHSFGQGFGAYTPWNYFYSAPSGPVYTPQTVTPTVRAKEYLAVIPRELHAGEDEQVSVTLFEEGSLTRRRGTHRVTLTLSKNGEEILETVEYISGKGSIQFTVPEVEEGEYHLTLKGDDFEGSTQVSVVDEVLLFVQTDKPIYQPGQTIRMRVISLDTALRPVSRAAVVEVNDAKGIKIFRKQVATDEYGMATLDLPISSEPNLGVWKIVAVCENADTQLDVRVERYVLPKYEVTPELAREWFLVDEPVTGTVKAEYSFGKPVRGDLVIEAKRYVGEWEVFETFTTEIDGETAFNIPAVGYVAGVPAAGGMGNITLDFTVKERNTNYEEKTNRLVTISSSPLLLQVIPEGSVFMPGLPFNLLIVTTTPDNAPVDAQVTVGITYVDSSLNTMSQRVDTTVTTAGGKALLTITPPVECVALVCYAESGDASLTKPVEAGYSPSGNFIHLEQISQGIPRVGESIRFKVHATNEAYHFYYEVVSRNRVVFSDYTELREISFMVTPAMAPAAKILVYQILPTSEVAADFLPFDVTADYPHQVTAAFDSEEVRPGDDISIAIQTEGKARVGIAAVDRSVFILAENRLNLQQVFAELERLYMEPQAELHSSSVYNEVYSKGALDIFEDAGVIVVSSKDVPQGKGYERYWWWKGGGWGGGPMFAFNAAPNMMEDADEFDSEPRSTFDTSNLAQVEKVRQFFPETWLWEDLITDEQGNAEINAEAPDTITTWKLQAVAISPQKGFGIGEDDLRVFQPFFISVDLPYSAIRG